jgi:3-oxoisoapionate kinase
MTSTDKPQTLKLAFYGDDFTGSTDALEVLAFGGLRCALFLSVPTPLQMAALGGFDAIGVAGASRAMSPDEMDAELPDVLSGLAALAPQIVHYKVCSTFDSAPTVGNIGRVIELSRSAFPQPVVPIIASTPALGRYCLFGHLFARSGTDDEVYRIDRHPIMSVHPVTPMQESDVARHLQKQAPLAIGNVPLTRLDTQSPAELAEHIRDMAPSWQAVVIDGLSPEHLTATGDCLQHMAFAQGTPLFVVGSSGVEYALTQSWQGEGAAPSADRYGSFGAVDQVLVVSGSASKLSAMQIEAALDAGFCEVAIDVEGLTIGPETAAAEARLVSEVVSALASGASVVMHTARGPADPRVARLIQGLQVRGCSLEQARHQSGRLVSERLGIVVDAIVRRHRLTRLVLSGGDTSSRITQALGPDALEIRARLAPGAPLCAALSSASHLSGLELALKGGQMGAPDYFVRALRGSAAAT